jgi:hypothetical protein
MQIRFTKGTVWAGKDRNEGEVLDVEPGHARLLVDGYKVAAFLGEAVPPVQAMVVNQDPEVESRDPVTAPKRRRAS